MTSYDASSVPRSALKKPFGDWIGILGGFLILFVGGCNSAAPKAPMIQKRKTRSRNLSKTTSLKRKRKKVHCKFCHLLVPIERAHRHENGWVGPECWDERLRPTS
jgi:hypothetical protein